MTDEHHDRVVEDEADEGRMFEEIGFCAVLGDRCEGRSKSVRDEEVLVDDDSEESWGTVSEGSECLVSEPGSSRCELLLLLSEKGSRYSPTHSSAHCETRKRRNQVGTDDSREETSQDPNSTDDVRLLAVPPVHSIPQDQTRSSRQESVQNRRLVPRVNDKDVPSQCREEYQIGNTRFR